jgi:hypothetical protein
MPRLIIKLENLIILITAVYFYYTSKGDWIIFAVLLLAPDISMIGYLIDKKIGSITYNLFHNYILPSIILLVGLTITSTIIQHIALILYTHVALDRLLGFGLKYPTDFKQTHIQKL